jgi:hypothetical protein
MKNVNDSAAKKETAAKVENYSAAMVAELKTLEPLTYAGAEAFAKKHGKSVRSVVAKAKRENIAYIPKPPATKKPAGITKKDIVANIASILNVKEEKVADLVKSSTACLNAVTAALAALGIEQQQAEAALENGTDATEENAEDDSEIFDDENAEDENAEDENAEDEEDEGAN